MGLRAHAHNVPSQCRILLRKLAFLQRLLRDDAVGVGVEVLHACVEYVCLVKECVELEEWFGCEFVGKLLRREGNCFKLMRKELVQKDRMMSVEKCKEKACMIAAVAERSRWPRIWDGALECGGRYTKCVQALTRLMSHHGRGKKPCPYCDSCEVPLHQCTLQAAANL